MVEIKKMESLRDEDMIKQSILVMRGQRVMLDRDLAVLYQVTTSNLNLAVRRNIERFPEDFMFQLTKDEIQNLMLQFAISSWGGSRHLPYAFTEHGVAMLSSVLKSKIAVQMNIFIIRAFIKMRESLDKYKNLALKIGKIELKQKEDGDILHAVHGVVKHLLLKPLKPKGKMGFDATR